MFFESFSLTLRRAGQGNKKKSGKLIIEKIEVKKQLSTKEPRLPSYSFFRISAFSEPS
jgi:hypothetical protein